LVWLLAIATEVLSPDLIMMVREIRGTTIMLIHLCVLNTLLFGNRKNGVLFFWHHLQLEKLLNLKNLPLHAILIELGFLVLW
jgi:hypothetical protein